MSTFGFYTPVPTQSVAPDSTRIASGTSTAQQVQNSNGVALQPGCAVLTLVSTGGTTPTVTVYDAVGAATKPIFSGTITAGAPAVINHKLKFGCYITFGAALTQDLLVEHSG